MRKKKGGQKKQVSLTGDGRGHLQVPGIVGWPGGQEVHAILDWHQIEDDVVDVRTTLQHELVFVPSSFNQVFVDLLSDANIFVDADHRLFHARKGDLFKLSNGCDQGVWWDHDTTDVAFRERFVHTVGITVKKKKKKGEYIKKGYFVFFGGGEKLSFFLKKSLFGVLFDDE